MLRPNRVTVFADIPPSIGIAARRVGAKQATAALSVDECARKYFA